MLVVSEVLVGIRAEVSFKKFSLDDLNIQNYLFYRLPCIHFKLCLMKLDLTQYDVIPVQIHVNYSFCYSVCQIQVY